MKHHYSLVTTQPHILTNNDNLIYCDYGMNEEALGGHNQEVARKLWGMVTTCQRDISLACIV